MIPSRHLATALCLASLLVGCGSKADYTGGASVKSAAPVVPAVVNPGEEASLFPLVVGNQWTFEVEGTSMSTNGGQTPLSGEITLKLTKVDDIPGGKQGTMEVYRNGQLNNRQVWSVTKDGVFQISSTLKLVPSTPPQPIAHFPLKEGEAIKWKGTGPFGGDPAVPMESTLTNKGPRTVDTGMGQMSAIMFESLTTIKTAKINAETQNTVWLKPGTGIVRLLQVEKAAGGQGAATLRLKSFTPGKQ